MRFLKEKPKTELAVVYLWTIANLNPKHNFSKEGTRRAWNDFRKPKCYEEGWPNNWIWDGSKDNDFVEQVDATLFAKLYTQAYGHTAKIMKKPTDKETFIIK